MAEAQKDEKKRYVTQDEMRLACSRASGDCEREKIEKICKNR